MIVLALIVILIGMGLVAISVTQQSSGTRSIVVNCQFGRAASELAESAVCEAVSDFRRSTARMTAGQDLRLRLVQNARAGVVEGPNILGRADFTIEPDRTRALIGQDGLPVKLSSVSVRPVRYDVSRNLGEVEFSCGAAYSLPHGHEARRRVVVIHYLSIDKDGKSIWVNDQPNHCIVDRNPPNE